MFFNFCLYSPSFPLRSDWRKSDSLVDGEPQGNWKWNSNFRECKPSFVFPPGRKSGSESLLAGYVNITLESYSRWLLCSLRTGKRYPASSQTIRYASGLEKPGIARRVGRKNLFNLTVSLDVLQEPQAYMIKFKLVEKAFALEILLS